MNLFISTKYSIILCKDSNSFYFYKRSDRSGKNRNVGITGTRPRFPMATRILSIAIGTCVYARCSRVKSMLLKIDTFELLLTAVGSSGLIECCLDSRIHPGYSYAYIGQSENGILPRCID